jgi:asparagine synthase (glutamine-hydrolysing)
MCRFFGNVGEATIEQSLFKELTLISKKGGPDSTEYYENKQIQFGFNRLAILDTSVIANQPFTTFDQRYTLMLNGEVYNYKELKTKYALNNVKSGSDAEVVLHLIEKISFEKAILELNGMFAISCWDSLEQRLYLARDFAGIKPLFYSQTSEGLVFGSQFNQLLRHPWCNNWVMSEIGLSEYLQFGYMLAPNTIAANINQLNVGEYVMYSLKDKKLVKYQYKTFFQDQGIVSEKVAQIGEILDGAIQRQMVSDVPLGVFLSGGIDSTLVAAKALQFKSDISAITIGFEDPRYDESPKAIEYAKHLGIKNHHVEKFGNQQLLDIYEDHFADMPEPIADYSSLPTYLVSKIARKTNTVMLSGDGGDELFWGYPRFLTFANSVKYFNIPGSINRKIAKKILKSFGSDVTGFLGKKDLGEANIAFQSYIEKQEILRLTQNYKLSEQTKEGYSFHSKNQRDSLDYLRKNEFYCHLQKILVKVDRMSMANSLEIRVPLLDLEVIKGAETLYSELGLNHKVLKTALKEELYKVIPKQIVEKQKRGFTPPLLNWSRNELKNEIISILQEGKNYGLSESIIQEMIQKYYDGSNEVSIEQLWTVYVLIKWLKTNKN